jgi:hypothetical protein
MTHATLPVRPALSFVAPGTGPRRYIDLTKNSALFLARNAGKAFK